MERRTESEVEVMLQVLLKQKELRDLQAEKEKLTNEAAGFEAREAELTKDIEAVESDEQRSVVQEAIDKFEAERDENKKKTDELDEKIRGIEAEIDELEKAQEDPEPQPEPEKRAGEKHMENRTLFGMDAAETRAFMEREDVKTLLAEVRSAMKEKRGITGAELTIPEVMLRLLRENIMNYSKLYRHVNVVYVNGQAVQPVMGTIPEAVWTQCCGKINELSLTFNAAEVGCWKIAGYLQLCRATEEDSDVDLAGEIVTALGAAIGLGLDKALIFGLGTRMPLGIFTRLAQTSKPADYDANERPWVDLHTTNILTISAANSVGTKLFQNIILDGAAAKGKYSRGDKVWVMNEKTFTTLQAEGLAVTAAGAIVTGVNGTMPVAGGIIEVLDFMPDNMIVGGYFDLYLLAERAGTSIQRDDSVKFLDDASVWKGTARYDGKPIIAEGFVAIGINNVTPSAAGISFAPDTANTESSAS